MLFLARRVGFGYALFWAGTSVPSLTEKETALKKENLRKLTLNKETLSSLETGKLIAVVGADNTLDGRLCRTNYTCPDTK
jgi:hypothetical protein